MTESYQNKRILDYIEEDQERRRKAREWDEEITREAHRIVEKEEAEKEAARARAAEDAAVKDLTDLIDGKGAADRDSFDNLGSSDSIG